MKAIVNKKSLIFLMPLLVGFGIFVLGTSARAGGWATDIMSGILSIFVWALGVILGLVLSGLIAIAGYQHFIDSQAVVLGWVLVRDICNMFFVVVLMIIAFGTILHLEEYNYKKWLPKLILMAVLINFSKTICGILIDVTQVAMLTFVNAFKDIGGGNATDMLGIQDIVTLAASDAGEASAVVGAYVLGVIYLIVAIVVIVTMMMMLAMRLVMIWIYVVLSPAAYLLAAFPGGQKYSSQWWSEFTKNLIVGPVLAFFIWLSLAALGTGQDMNNFDLAAADSGNNKYDTAVNSKPFAETKGSTPSALIKFVVAIGMLVGGLMVSQQIGGAAGGMAGKGMSALQKGQAMGMRGLAAVTGVRYASGVLKSYSSQRKAVREESYRIGAEKLAGKIGLAKDMASRPLKRGASWLRENTYGKYGVEAREASREASEARKQADIYATNFRRNKSIDSWNHNDNDTWSNETGDIKTQSEMSDYVEDKVNGLNAVASKKEDESNESRNKQAKIDKYTKYGLAAVGATLSLATGGLAGLGVTAAGMASGKKLWKNIKQAGSIDFGIASNWRLRQISENKDKIKNDSNDSVITAMDDDSKSIFSRAAATLEAIERGLLSGNNVKNRKIEMQENLGGRDKDGGWKDKKVGSYVNGILERKQVGETPLFDDLSSPDQIKRADAKKVIEDRYEQGVYSLDLDTGALEKSINILVTTMRNSEFTRQFKALKDESKKGIIIKALKNNNSQEAKQKLAFVKDLNFAFGADQAGKEKALSEFSSEDLANVFRKGDIKQQEAIREAVHNSNQSDRINIFVNAKNELEGDSPYAKEMRRKLGI